MTILSPPRAVSTGNSSMPPEHGGTLEEHGSGAADRRPGRLAVIAGVRGERVASAANRPVRLDDPERVWLVERGALDVFLVRVRDGTAEAPFHHVLRLETGRLAFGAAGTEGLRVVAKGLPGTILRRMSAADLTRGPSEIDFVRTALTETMSEAYREMHETWRERDLPDLRTAAFLIAIERIASNYLALGIFP